MKILLIQPPIEDFYYTSIRRQPLGLLSIAASLKKDGHDVSLLNSHTKKKKQIPLPKSFSYLEEFIKHPEKECIFPFKAYYHFGLSFQEIARQVRNYKDCDIFCISSLFTPYYQEVDRIIEMIKDCSPEAKIIVGGYHAAMYPDYYLLTSKADFVVTGEGEETISFLIKSFTDDSLLPASVPNLAFCKDGEIVKTPKKRIKHTNSLLFPERSLLKDKDLKFYHKRGVSIVATRGCPHACSFCSNRELWGKEYIRRDISSVIDEIDLEIKMRNINLFNFEDDNLFCDKEYAKNLLTELIKYQQYKNIKLDLSAMNGLSIEKMDDVFLELFKRAGFNEINLSLVTHSKLKQKEIGRPFDSVHFSSVVNKAVSLDLKVRGYFILGLPVQTKEEVEETIQFMKELRVMQFPSVFYNVYSARKDWKMQRSSAFYNETEHLGRKDLVRYFNLSHAANSAFK